MKVVVSRFRLLFVEKRELEEAVECIGEDLERTVDRTVAVEGC